MIEMDAGVEYAVEIPGRGYAFDILSPSAVSPDPVSTTNRAYAEHVLRGLKARYVSMGCADIAETIRLISRTATVTRSEWGPVTKEDS